MSLPHALLGLLNYRDLTGYDLKSTFESSIHFFWNASLPQIYRTLHQMEKNGWLTSSLEQQITKPNKKVYSITTDGKNELRRWLEEPLSGELRKSEMTLKVFFGNQMDIGALINQLNTRKEEELLFLKEAESKHTQSAQDYGEIVNARNDIAYWLLALDLGVRRAKMTVEWCDEVIEILKKIADKFE